MEYEKTVYTILKNLRVPMKYDGFKITTQAVCFVASSEERVHLQGDVYPRVSMQSKIPVRSVERNIRSVADYISKKAPDTAKVRYFGEIALEKEFRLTNKALVYGLAEYVRHM